MIEAISVGEPYSRVVGKREGCYFDINYPNIELIYNYAHPTQEEIKQFGSDIPFEIRAVEFNDIIFITTKCGSLPWNDAPYNPQLGNCELDIVDPGYEGYALQLIMTDSPSGTVKHLRLIGLGNDFSIKFRELILANKSKNIPLNLYELKLSQVYASYKSSKLADFSTLRYKVK